VDNTIYNVVHASVLATHNAQAPLAIDCAKTQQVCNEKIKFLVWGVVFFVSDIISKVGLRPFWLMLPGLGSNHYMEVYCSSFH